MRQKIIAGNWKMNKDLSTTLEFLAALKENLQSLDLGENQVVVCPAYPFLQAAWQAVENSPIRIGAQNVNNHESGAYTGEISVSMLHSIGCHYCIIGHSERRKYFAETDALVNEKLLRLLAAGIIPIVCIGETLEERQAGITKDVITTQLEGAFRNVTKIRDLVIAYEPVWAIGTGITATPAQAQEIHSLIRTWFVENASREIAEQLPILYGGSVKPDNIHELLLQPDIDGGLIGGASLQITSFVEMIKRALNT